jgi:hypothetical protein
LDYGPVPKLCYNIIKFVRGDNDVSNLFEESIKEGFKVFGDNKIELLNENIDDNSLSVSDKECLDAAITKYGKYNFNELKKESHDKIYNSIANIGDEFTIYYMLKVLDKDEKFAEHCLQIFDK